MTVYADEVFAVNSVSNILLIYACNTLWGEKNNHLRIISAACIGGLYAVLEAAAGISFFVRPIVLIIMAAAANGFCGVFAKAFRLMLTAAAAEVIMLIFSQLIGSYVSIEYGTATVFENELLVFVLYISAYPLLCLINYIKGHKNKYCTCTVIINGRSLAMKSLYDSGNSLKYKDKPVVIASFNALSELLDASDYNELMSSATDFVLYSTISGGGVIPVIKPDKLLINKIEQEAYIGVTDRMFSGVSAICGIR